MAGFGGAERQAHGFGLAHFTDHQHIRIFPQGIQQGLFKARGIPPDFALADIRAARAERIFNGIFHGDDVAGLGQVDFLNQGRQRGRLAATGWAAH